MSSSQQHSPRVRIAGVTSSGPVSGSGAGAGAGAGATPPRSSSPTQSPRPFSHPDAQYAQSHNYNHSNRPSSPRLSYSSSTHTYASSPSSSSLSLSSWSSSLSMHKQTGFHALSTRTASPTFAMPKAKRATAVTERPSSPGPGTYDTSRQSPFGAPPPAPISKDYYQGTSSGGNNSPRGYSFPTTPRGLEPVGRPGSPAANGNSSFAGSGSGSADAGFSFTRAASPLTNRQTPGPASYEVERSFSPTFQARISSSGGTGSYAANGAPNVYKSPAVGQTTPAYSIGKADRGLAPSPLRFGGSPRSGGGSISRLPPGPGAYDLPREFDVPPAFSNLTASPRGSPYGNREGTSHLYASQKLQAGVPLFRN
eukprot:ANDGO_00006.mRNA.1 hypothetical protein